MAESQATFHRGVQTILSEILDGPPGPMAFLLNPGDPGLVKQLDSVDSARASSRPMAGQTTIAAHVDHVVYGFELLNLWAEGNPDPWKNADWSASWKRTTVDDAAWESLRRRLKATTAKWKHALAARTDWDDVSAAGAVGMAAHTAYHLGAIRQLLAATEK